MTGPIRKLAIVGASARAAAFSAIRAGYEVVAADMFADADLKRVAPVTRIENYPDGLADWLAATECDAWMYTGALENYPDLVDRMAAIRPLLGSRGAALREVRDPLKLQQAVSQAGLSFPDTVAWAEGLPQDSSWLCKTYRGASGTGVWRLDGPAAWERAKRTGAVFQRLIDGRVWEAAVIYVLSADRSELVGRTAQFVGGPSSGARPWQYYGSQTTTPGNDAVFEQLIRLRDVLVRRFGLRGLIGVDLIMQDDRVWVIEVNPRYTASVEIVERVMGPSAISGHVAACGHDSWESFNFNPLAPSEAWPERSFGKQIVFAKQQVTITEDFYSWAMAGSSLDPSRATLADIPHLGETFAAGDPVLTVFADGPNWICGEYLRARLAEVEARLYRGQ